MTEVKQGLSRRAVLGSAGALVIAVNLAACKDRSLEPVTDAQIDTPASPMNAFLELSSDGFATIHAPHPEIGQGVKTSLPMIVAEELDMPWEKVRVVQSAIDEKYGFQFAGGSRSIPSLFNPLREAGAKARSVLIAAAAQEWGVTPEDCRTENGSVISGKKSLGYGELASAAGKLPVPDAKDLTFKDRKDYKLLGQRITGVDNEKLVTGQPLFGIDIDIPNMHFASYTKCPATGGTVKSFNVDAIKAQPGVVDAFALQGQGAPDALKPGVAIVGTSTWAVFKAKKALEIEWDTKDAATLDWDAFTAKARKTVSKPGKPLYSDGDVDAAFKDAAKTVEAVYTYPFLPHAPLEPQNCTAYAQDGAVEIWAPTQMPTAAVGVIAKAFGYAPEKITLNQTRAGGGFGRRLVNDYVAEAVAISRKTNLPIKVQWTREDDFGQDFYRPGGVHGLKASLDKDGKLTGYRTHFMTFTGDGEKPFPQASYPEQSQPRHLVPNLSVEQTMEPLKVPLGWWRAPISNAFAFVTNGFLDEISQASGGDFVDNLVALMGEPRVLPKGQGGNMDTGRAVGVIKEAARRSGWGKDMPKGRGLGLAFCFSHDGYVAEVADVEVSADKSVKIHKVWVVADVGPIVNLSGAENQCEGSVVDGLSTMMGLQADFKNGRAGPENFDNYPMMRMPNVPDIDVHFIQSDNPPTGLGEPALPPLAPAVTNAIFAATGDRIRDMPLSKSGYSFSA